MTFQGPIPKVRKQGRIKPKYNATPKAHEKAYHVWLIENFVCFCECGAQAGCVHHPLTRHPEQRWRRDHEYVVPMADGCHKALHLAGSEAAYAGHLDFAQGAAEYRRMGQREGFL